MALYDPTPRETVDAPSLDFTVADVLAWARKKPADEWYKYDNNRECALCQFLRETARALRPVVLPGQWAVGFANTWHPYDERIEPALKSETFGALVKRLEALA